MLKEAAKKVIFFGGPNKKALTYTPPLPELNGHRIFLVLK